MNSSLTKAVFRPGEIVVSDTRVFLEAPITLPDLSDIQQEENMEEVYQGPTAEELRREAEQFKVQWEAEKETMMMSAKLEVDRVIQNAEDEARQEVIRKTEEAGELKRVAFAEAEKIITDAQQKAEELIATAQASIEAQRRKAEEEGDKAGRDAGFKQGKVEVDRLIQRTHVVLERAQEKRTEILLETEQRIIELVILLTRKVIKVISENQREVIVANVQDALRKVKGRGDIIIRVHTADLPVTTEHLREFIQQLEISDNIQVQEDSLTVDQGGCIIETDFGEIDARISSQLAELEAKILEIVPVKTKPKQPAPKPAGDKV
jgi:flagellar assembly protein FliH